MPHQARDYSLSSASRSFAHTFRVNQIPIAECAARPAHLNPRVRSLAAFERRPLRSRLRRSWPASETLHRIDKTRNEYNESGYQQIADI